MYNRKKILLVPEFSSFGGTRSHLIYLLEFYYSQNYEVVIALSKKQIDEEILSILKRYKYTSHIIKDERTGLKRFLRYFPLNLIYDIPTIIPIYLKEKPDIIVVSNGTPGMFIGLILFPAKFIYTFHTYPLKSKIPGLISIQKLFLNLFMNTNKALVTVSEYSKKQILAYWVPEKKSNSIHVIYNSAKRAVTFKSSLQNETKDTCRILTLGHVNWYKNPKLWIEVSHRIIQNRPNAHLEFIWVGEGELLEECKNLVKQTGLENIKFIGYKENVDSIYNNSTIYFQPSLLESHGISVIEAMAHGLPCVTSDTGGLPESVVNGKTGFMCSPNDIECFVSQIIKLIDDDELRYRMGEAGKVRAETFFVENVQERKMIDLYTSLLDK